MQAVVLDANALLLPFQFRVNLESELRRLLGDHERGIPHPCVRCGARLPFVPGACGECGEPTRGTRASQPISGGRAGPRLATHEGRLQGCEWNDRKCGSSGQPGGNATLSASARQIRIVTGL